MPRFDFLPEILTWAIRTFGKKNIPYRFSLGDQSQRDQGEKEGGGGELRGKKKKKRTSCLKVLKETGCLGASAPQPPTPPWPRAAALAPTPPSAKG